jgi:hypothetical protein
MSRFNDSHDGINGIPGPTGPKGDIGQTGAKGDSGSAGPGVPTGGTEGQILTKVNATDYNSTWQDPALAVLTKMQYGSFYDLTSQHGTDNSIQAIYCNVVDFNHGILMENSSGGTVNPSRVKILNAGRYNLQFSAQFHQTNSSAVVNLWLSKNGTTVPNSNTKFDITSNNPYYVAAWNFFVDAAPGDYYELIWSSTKANTVIEYVATSSGHPAVPSVILTVHQIGL